MVQLPATAAIEYVWLDVKSVDTTISRSLLKYQVIREKPGCSTKIDSVFKLALFRCGTQSHSSLRLHWSMLFSMNQWNLIASMLRQSTAMCSSVTSNRKSCILLNYSQVFQETSQALQNVRKCSGRSCACCSAIFGGLILFRYDCVISQEVSRSFAFVA